MKNIKKYSKDEIINLFDDEQYEEVSKITSPYNKNNLLDYEILYYLKSKLVINNFKIINKEEIKELFFYYFYLTGKVDFENNYCFSFNRKNLKIDFLNLKQDIKGLQNFRQYFNLGKNEIFLNKIIDKTNLREGLNYREGALEVDNVVDFFIYFTYECSELYAFSGEHFPLFKWLINELINE